MELSATAFDDSQRLSGTVSNVSPLLNARSQRNCSEAPSRNGCTACFDVSSFPAMIGSRK